MNCLAAADNAWFAGALVAVVGALLIHAAWRKGKLAAWRAEESTAKADDAKPSTPSAPSATSGEYGRWQVEMHDLSRELRAQLDNKIVILERLVREAEQQSARLEAALAAARREAGMPSRTKS